MRKDPYTGELFEPKRNNQKFANRANQIAFNNEKARQERNMLATVNGKLIQNGKIINDLLGSNETLHLSKDFLLGKGFDFTTFNRLLSDNGVTVYGIYGFYLKPLGGEKYEIGRFTD